MKSREQKRQERIAKLIMRKRTRDSWDDSYDGGAGEVADEEWEEDRVSDIGFCFE